MRNLNRWPVHIPARVLILTALALLVLPLKWLCALILAAVWHELCHATAVSCCSGRILHFHIGSSGAVMESTPLTPCRELICILAGPLGSLSLLLLTKYFPRTAICGFVHGLYNLLPVFPLDGGRALFTASNIMLPKHQAEAVCKYTSIAAKAFIIGLCCYYSWTYRLGPMPVFLGFFLLLRLKREKFLANFRHNEYNRATILTR